MKASSKQHWFALIVSMLAGSLYAQEFRGTITGRVTDPQKAAIPGVKIAATLVSTGAVSETTSSGEGQFTIPFLAPSQYRVQAQAAGFKRYARENLQVSAGERIGLDIELAVGELAETVSVTAEAPLLEASTATAGQVISSNQVENMPLNGRTPRVLAQLAFGVVPNSDPKFNRPFDNVGPSGFSMGGAPAQMNELLIDGAADTTGNLRVAYNPPVDAVMEVRVHAFEADAAYGHTGGGTANVIMKSGTNELRGSAYEFNQVSKLAATPFFTNKAKQKKPVTRFNQWGFTAGAPIWIPKVFNGKNKVFWFYGMEFINDSFPEPTTTTVPTDAERRCDLSALLSVGSNYTSYDPRSGVAQGSRIARTPFSGNIIPSDRRNSISKNFLQFYPPPNMLGGADGQNNFLTNAVRRDTYNSEIGRLDFNLSQANKLFWNFRHNDRIEDLYNFWNSAAHGQFLGRINWGTSLDDVHSFSPTTLMNVRLNWTRFKEPATPIGDLYNPTQLGLPASVAAAALRLTLPHITFKGSSAGPFEQITNATYGNTPYDIFQIFGDVVKVVSRHSLKFGVDVRELRENNVGYGYSTGQYNFDTNWTRGPLDNATAAPVGQEWAAFMLGLPTGGGLDMNAFRTGQSKYLAVFVQDDWRVRSNLTLNLGLRYERDFGMTERFNRSVNNFDPTTANPVAAQAIAAYNANPIPQIPVGQFKVNGGPVFASSAHPAIYQPQSKILSPRFGFAWTPGALKGTTVIRGGGGVFMFPVGSGATPVNQPGFSQTTAIVPTQNSYLTPYATLSNPYPDGFQTPTGSSLGLATNLGKSIYFFNPVVRNPYSIRWEFSVQRTLPGNSVLEMAYIGNHAVHLTGDRELDYVPAQYLSTSPVRDQTTIDTLTALVSNPFQGLLLLANFTYSKLIARDNLRNPTDQAPEKRVAADDRPLRFVASASYTLPFGKGKAIDFHSGLWNRIAGGWTMNGIYVNLIGAPLTWGSNLIYFGGPLNMKPHPENLDAPAFDTSRFNTVSNQQLANNINVFPTRFGSLRQDGANNIDLSILKDTQINEKVKFQIRAEAFNAGNRPSFDPPNLSPTNSAFGKITNQPNLARSIQLGARLVW